MSISTRLGLAVASGVPVLVLVSMGPVAGLAGAPSALIWAFSAVLGFFMALAFADLAASMPHVTGGIGTLAGRVLSQRSRSLGVIAQWSYWFGWSPALAINGALVGTYLHDVFLPHSPTWTVILLALLVLGGSVTVNHYGMRPGARLHVLLIVCVAVPVALLIGTALLRGQFQPGRLLPFAPPGGWVSGHGLVAVSGGLFLAGWSAYGSELALSYGTEYRQGVRDAVKTLIIMAIASALAYSLIPLVLVGVLGVPRIQADPAVALQPLAQHIAGGMADLVVGVLILALLLGVNMVMIASSRTLYQAARNGDAWQFLGKVNRHGVPGNALRFDLAVNTVLLLAVFAMNRGRTSNIPLALLAACNVGYILSIILALAAARMRYRQMGEPSRLFRIRPGLMRVAMVIAVLNVALLLTAGFAWGWPNVLIGAAVLGSVVVVFSWRTRRAPATPAVSTPPVCMAWGVPRPVERAANLPQRFSGGHAL